jgi:ADP-heptose:LPS heptosyltransferase
MDEAAWAAMCPPVRQRYAAEGITGAGATAPAAPAAPAAPGLSGKGGGRRLGRALVLGPLHRVAAFRLARRPAPAALPQRARILLIQPDNLGGMLLTTPVMRLLKAALPDCELTVMAGAWAADVAGHCPAVDRVEVCPFPGFGRPAGGADGAGAVARLGRAISPWSLLARTAPGLAAEGYHLAVVCHADFFWGAALAAVAGIPHRLGYATSDAAPFLSRSLPLPPRPVGAPARARPAPGVAALGLALAREALDLAGADVPAGFDGKAQYEPAPPERAAAARLWRNNRLDEARAVVAIHPAPGAPAKRWPAQRFAIVADHFAGRYGARIVVTGGPGDVDEARAVAAACHRPPLVLAGETSFGELAALLERCRLVLGTDNGALHLATTRGVPTVRLFGPVDPAAWGGWTGLPGGPPPPPTVSVAAGIACAPCHRLDLPPWTAVAGGGPGAPAGDAYPCMRDVTAEAVIAAVERVWAVTERPPAAPAARTPASNPGR